MYEDELSWVSHLNPGAKNPLYESEWPTRNGTIGRCAWVATTDCVSKEFGRCDLTQVLSWARCNDGKQFWEVRLVPMFSMPSHATRLKGFWEIRRFSDRCCCHVCRNVCEMKMRAFTDARKLLDLLGWSYILATMGHQIMDVNTGKPTRPCDMVQVFWFTTCVACNCLLVL